MMEAARTSETLLNFYQTTRRYNPEDSRLRKCMYENWSEAEVTVETIEIAKLKQQVL
jgi:hypothetical protein